MMGIVLDRLQLTVCAAPHGKDWVEDRMDCMTCGRQHVDDRVHQEWHVVIEDFEDAALCQRAAAVAGILQPDLDLAGLLDVQKIPSAARDPVELRLAETFQIFFSRFLE